MLSLDSVRRKAVKDVVREVQNLHKVQVTLPKPSTVPIDVEAWHKEAVMALRYRHR